MDFDFRAEVIIMPPTKRSCIRKAVSPTLLRLDNHAGNFTVSTFLANALSITADNDNVKGNDNITIKVNSGGLLVWAFSNQVLDEYTQSYDDAFHFEGDKNVLCNRWTRSLSWNCLICRHVCLTPHMTCLW